MSAIFEAPVPPPEALELLKNDPRVELLKLARPGITGDQLIVEPQDPPVVGESRYLVLSPRLRETGTRSAKVNWVNEPDHAWAGGEGKGLDFITEKPCIKDSGRKPRNMSDIWTYLGWFVASPKFIEVLRRFDPEIARTIEIDWEFSDGQKRDGYIFMDICRSFYAYDYARSQVLIRANDRTRNVVGMGMKRALKPNIDPAIHAFRDAYLRSNVFVSRELAKELVKAGVRQVSFDDPATMWPAKL